MLNAFLVIALAESLVEAILAPAIRQSEDVTQIHVLQDAIQKIRQPRYHTHPDFAVGSTYGQSSYRVQAHVGTSTLDEVIAVVRDNLDRHTHDDLNAFYQFIGCQSIDYAYHMGFVLGWLIALIDDGKAPVYDGSVSRTGARI